MRTRSVPAAMMSLFLVCILLCMSFPAMPAATNVETRVLSATVLVHVVGALGTGFCVSNHDGKTFFVTCAHVVLDAPIPGWTVGIRGREEPLVAVVERVDESHDLALVSVDEDLLLPVLHLAKRIPDIGHHIFSAGHPMGFTAFLSHGFSQGSETVNLDNRDLLPIDMQTSPGMSGSALCNERGEVIGVIDAAIRDSHIGLAVPLEVLRTFLQQ